MRIIERLSFGRKTDYNFRTYTSSLLSLLAGLAFSLYNGFLGIRYLSAWNAAICFYYVILSAVRGIIVNSLRKAYSGGKAAREHGNRLHIVTHIILFVMNIFLIIPIASMITFFD